jgi:hypothetical protein
MRPHRTRFSRLPGSGQPLLCNRSLYVTAARSAIPFSNVNLTMEVGNSCETFAPVFLSTRCHIPENWNLYCATHKAGQFCKQQQTRHHNPQQSKDNAPSYSVPRNDLYSTIPRLRDEQTDTVPNNRKATNARISFNSHCLSRIIHKITQRKQQRDSTATAVRNMYTRSVFPINFAPDKRP